VRKNKGLLITMIIIIVLLIVAVVGLLLYKFVFSKNKTKPNITNQISSNQSEEPQKYEIKVGDYVDYTPSKAAD